MPCYWPALAFYYLPHFGKSIKMTTKTPKNNRINSRYLIKPSTAASRAAEKAWEYLKTESEHKHRVKFIPSDHTGRRFKSEKSFQNYHAEMFKTFILRNGAVMITAIAASILYYCCFDYTDVLQYRVYNSVIGLCLLAVAFNYGKALGKLEEYFRR